MLQGNKMSVLDIDLYQVTMLRAWFYHGLHNKKAAMEVFTRTLPNNRSYLVAVGISRIQEMLSKLKFTIDDIEILRSIEKLKIDDSFANYLLSVDFSKEIELYAMDEGEIFFPNQPVIRLEGPIGLIQYVEKMVLSILNHDVRIASKACRIVISAKGRPVYELGGRRAHESTNADVARAAYIAGFAGTSSVEAYKQYGVPVFGSQGHVWIMSFPTEEESCKAWSEVYQENSINLIDTYHAWTGVELAIKYAKKGAFGGIRLDSGNLCEQSINFRRLMNKSDHIDSKIFASDDLNEYKISDMIFNGAHIDAFGVGTEVVSTPDAPTCGFVCKLVAIENSNGTIRNICKLSTGGKGTWPGIKQVWRNYVNRTGEAKDKQFTHDLISLIDETKPSMTIGLLSKKELNLTGSLVERNGLMEAARTRFLFNVERMPAVLKLLEGTYKYPIEFSEELINEKNRIVQSMGKTNEAIKT